MEQSLGSPVSYINQSNGGDSCCVPSFLCFERERFLVVRIQVRNTHGSLKVSGKDAFLLQLCFLFHIDYSSKIVT